MVFQIVWYFFLVYINYLVVAYFNLVCLMISKRFKTVCNEIEELADAEPGAPGSKNDQINQLYFDHNEVCELVDESNSFWQSYIFCTFMTYIPCACYVLYNIFFADFNTTLMVFTWGIFFHTLIILAIICISAADVSAEVSRFWAVDKISLYSLLTLAFPLPQAHAPYTALHTLSLLQLPIDLEVNVSSRFELKNFLVFFGWSWYRLPPKMSTFLHRVRGPTIGYSCLDLFVVTNSSISNVSNDLIVFGKLDSDSFALHWNYLLNSIYQKKKIQFFSSRFRSLHLMSSTDYCGGCIVLLDRCRFQ